MSSFTEFAHMLTNTISDNIHKFETNQAVVHSDRCAKDRSGFNHMHSPCNCNKSKNLILKLKAIDNMQVHKRLASYREFLAQHKDLFGIIVSNGSLKSVGIINLKGEIRHFNGVHAVSPYSIVVNNQFKNILAANKSSHIGKETTLGTCVNSKGAKIASLARSNGKNFIKPITKTTDKKAPVLAIFVNADLKPALSTAKTIQNTKEPSEKAESTGQTGKALDKLLHRSMY